MKNFVVLVEIDLGAKTEEIALNRVKRIPFGNNDCDFRIVGIKEGSIPPGTSLYDVEPNLVNEQNEGDIANRLDPGQTYCAKVNGWRVPFLSMYRNIISANIGACEVK